MKTLLTFTATLCAVWGSEIGRALRLSRARRAFPATTLFNETDRDNAPSN